MQVQWYAVEDANNVDEDDDDNDYNYEYMTMATSYCCC